MSTLIGISFVFIRADSWLQKKIEKKQEGKRPEGQWCNVLLPMD